MPTPFGVCGAARGDPLCDRRWRKTITVSSGHPDANGRSKVQVPGAGDGRSTPTLLGRHPPPVELQMAPAIAPALPSR